MRSEPGAPTSSSSPSTTDAGPAAALQRPIRVVLFLGHVPEPAALELLGRLEEHPEADMVGGLRQVGESGPESLLRNVLRRRGALGPLVWMVSLLSRAAWYLRKPPRRLALRRSAGRAMERVQGVPDFHAPEVLARVESWDPDLGVIYGGPILRSELFRIPTRGTLGIHHGTVPRYRGLKTTFWEMYNGEEEAGVTVQRLNERLDTGEVALSGSVPIGERRYGRVWREVQEVGIDLLVEAVLRERRGTARYRPQEGERGPLYPHPDLRHILELWRRRVRRIVD